MMGLPSELRFINQNPPKTNEEIVKSIEELENYNPKNWLSAMWRNAELQSLKKSLDNSPKTS
jgi:hypothetical protein